MKAERAGIRILALTHRASRISTGFFRGLLGSGDAFWSANSNVFVNLLHAACTCVLGIGTEYLHSQSVNGLILPFALNTIVQYDSPYFRLPYSPASFYSSLDLIRFRTSSWSV